ncbi:MAG TPA: 30S ribosomal protein S20 [Planctomycetota bacterium]|nr:30S ribosomal protein S20 [Planctomycetota bacterium]
MPHSENAKKTLRQNERRRAANKAKRSAMRTFTKRVTSAIEVGDKKLALEELRIAQAQIDKAAKTRVIHPSTAARRKSALARQIAALA